MSQWYMVAVEPPPPSVKGAAAGTRDVPPRRALRRRSRRVCRHRRRSVGQTWRLRQPGTSRRSARLRLRRAPEPPPRRRCVHLARAPRRAMPGPVHGRTRLAASAQCRHGPCCTRLLDGCRAAPAGAPRTRTGEPPALLRAPAPIGRGHKLMAASPWLHTRPRWVQPWGARGHAARELCTVRVPRRYCTVRVPHRYSKLRAKTRTRRSQCLRGPRRPASGYSRARGAPPLHRVAAHR